MVNRTAIKRVRGDFDEQYFLTLQPTRRLSYQQVRNRCFAAPPEQKLRLQAASTWSFTHRCPSVLRYRQRDHVSNAHQVSATVHRVADLCHTHSSKAAMCWMRTGMSSVLVGLPKLLVLMDLSQAISTLLVLILSL